MARLFISYTREDGKAFVDRLCAELGGHDAWLDRAELAGGADWERDIRQAIHGSDFFLPVLTNAYDGARFARLELARAFRIGKPLIPLRASLQADMSLFLETTQYIDFSDPAAHQASLRALLDRIAEISGQADELEAVPVVAARWESMRVRADRQTRCVVTPAFNPALYVRRESAETELARFLESPASALFVIGDSGLGKTSLLCHWALDLLGQGHAVLTYDCSTLADTDIEAEIARDLSISPDAIAELDEEAARAGRSVVILFDSISDYRGSESNGTQVLIRRIYALVSRLPGRNVRVVASCNAMAWDRLRRLAPIRFDRERFHHCGDDPFLRLATFTDAERDDAYTRYQQVFDLHSGVEALPPAVRERLRDPVLLRMVAEAYRGAKQPLLAANLGLAIYRRYFEDRVSLPRESWLVHELAEEMLRRQASALPMMDLARHERLGPEILSENPSSTYSQLLERGVLQEARGDIRSGIVVKFSHTRVAAYALAVNLLERPNVAETVAELVRTAAEFPLGWEVARTLLQLSRDEAAFLALAGSSDLEQRLLAAEALVEWYSEDAAAGGRLLRRLLDQSSEATRRTALRAAYSIGPEARDFFLHAAVNGEPSMRESVKNTLYLIWRQESPAARSGNETLYPLWRHAPGFTHDFLNSLLAEIRPRNVKKAPAVLEFILDLTITIYINHCDEPDVLDKTSEILHDLCVKRLHLHRVKTGILGAAVEKIVGRAVARVLGQQMLNWMLFADQASTPAFFRMPAESRALLGRAADYFDPATSLATAYEDVLALLREETPIFNGTAATVLAIHACHDFRGTEPLIRRLWNEVGSRERRWLLISLGILVRDTPPEWVPLLEDLTRRYVTEQREDFLHPPSLLAHHLDTVLMPLGLAYGRLGSRPALFEQILRDAMASGDTPMASRCIAALAPAGFYYPHALFDVLRPAFAKLDDSAIANALMTTLATVRTLHFDAVDQFLSSVDAPEPFRHRVDAAADVTLVHRYIRVLGFYNSGVYISIHYPRMRPTITAGSLRLMAAAQSPVQFVADYTLSVLHLLRDAKFRMQDWTLPE
jgi:hypothetical protein